MTRFYKFQAARRSGRGAAARRVFLEELEPRLVLSSTLGLQAKLIVDPVDKDGSVPLKEFAGVFREGTWYLDQDDQGVAGEGAVLFGIPGDKPVVGYFDGDGHADFAVVRNGLWMFDLNERGGRADKKFAFGLPADVPLVGKWAPDGSAKRSVEQAAVFRQGMWFFDHDGNGGSAEDKFAFGIPGDVPVAGDFDGDGLTDAGVFRDGVWYLDLDRAGGPAEYVVVFGVPGDQPLVGDWDGDGMDELAVKRASTWFFDLDGAGGMAEKSFAFGFADDMPVAGSWQSSGSGNRGDGATTNPGADPGSSSLATIDAGDESDIDVPEDEAPPATVGTSRQQPIVTANDNHDKPSITDTDDDWWDEALLDTTDELVLLAAE
jgi:hypothetical protein